ncbi:MAG: DNRLRE domain-containing protein [Theionarchaea archaeon]|nr:DNRLRE domain-containing protein [Theionarchaea archaeon]
MIRDGGKTWISCGVLVILILSSQYVLNASGYESIPHSFFVDLNGHQNCLIVVGEHADASDIIEASRLAVTIGELYSPKQEIPVVKEVDVTHDNVHPGACIVETPLQLSTLWWFDDYDSGVYGNGNTKFDPWETHEEIQLFIDDIKEVDPLLGVLVGNNYLDFSTIYRIDNVRCPPYVWVYSYVEGTRGEHITGFQNQQVRSYAIIDPYFVYRGYLPEVCIFGTTYKVVYISSSVLITGNPHLKYVYLYKDQPFRTEEFTISLLDVDVDHNKCYLSVQGSGVREEFWMVLDPLHGFSPDLQEMGSQEIVAYDIDGDGTVDYADKTETGLSELDVWGHNMGGGAADLVIDGIKIFIGEDIGVYLGVYWVEDVVVWNEYNCCDPFVKYPQYYSFKIRPETVALQADEDSYADQGLPLQNFGGESFLSVRSSLGANARSFVKFRLPVLPEKAIISKATLQLIPLTDPGSRVYEVSRVTSPWDEASITWSTQPGSSLTGTQVNNIMQWDVTSDVVAFYGGTPNYGWRISDQTENSVVPYETQFGSRESSMKPRLILEYTFDCNHTIETIPHTLNWINTYYDDVNDDAIIDPVYEIDISLCTPIRTLCSPLFFEGPNYYYYVDFTDTYFGTGVDFRVYQTKKVGEYSAYTVVPEPWKLIRLESEITKKDAGYNWILVGGENSWVQKLVARNIKPDDNYPADWFEKEAGYKLYTDPFGFGNRILVVAGKTSADTQKAIRIFIEDMKALRSSES